MTKERTSFIPDSAFLDFRPVTGLKLSTPKIDKQENPRVSVFGDLHGSDYSLIQQLIMEDIISFSAEDLSTLSALARSTYTEQLQVVREAHHQFYGNVIALRRRKSHLKALLALPFAHENNNYEQQLIAIEKELTYNLWQSEIKKLHFQKLCEEIKSEMWQFKETLQHMEILDLQRLILLIGDEICDRANCDWRMLLLLSELKNRGIELHSLLSNHGFEGLYAYLMGRMQIMDELCLLKDPQDTFQSCNRSLRNTRILLEADILSYEEYSELMNSWADSLHLLTASYSETDNNFTLYTHAPVGFETIKALAVKYEVTYCDSTPKELCETIQKIDQCFRDSLQINPVEDLQILAEKYGIVYEDHTIEALTHTIAQLERSLLLNSYEESNQLDEEDKERLLSIHQSFLYQFCQEKNAAAQEYGGGLSINGSGKIFPLLAILWNRERAYLDCPETLHGFKCDFVYGHDTFEKFLYEELPDNRWELDNSWGKPYSPCSIQYYYDPHKLIFINSLEENDKGTVIAYQCYAEESSFYHTSNLPKHYFSGIITLPRIDDTGLRAKKLAELIQEDMDESTVPTMLYSDQHEEIRYLTVSNESFSFTPSTVIEEVQASNITDSPTGIAQFESTKHSPSLIEETPFFTKNNTGLGLVFSTPLKAKGGISSLSNLEDSHVFVPPVNVIGIKG